MLNNRNLDAGASKSAGQIIASFDPRLRDPARFIVRAWGYLLVIFVIYLILIQEINENRSTIAGWAVIYISYLFVLELSRRRWIQQYDRREFHVLRIIINLGMITWLISLAKDFSYLLSFFYLIPIFAGIVYFSNKIWVGIITLAISMGGIVLNELLLAPWERNLARVLLPSVGIILFSTLVFWLYHRAIKSTSQFSLIVWDLHRTLNLHDLIKQTSDNAIQITNANFSLVIIIDPQTGRYVNHICVGFELREGASIEDVIKECSVLSDRTPFDCPDIISIFREKSIYIKYFKRQPKSVLAEPLFDSEGRIIGVLNVGHNVASHFGSLEKSQLKEFSGTVSTAIANCLSNRKAKLIEARDVEEGIDFSRARSENEIFNILAKKLKENFLNADGYVIHRFDSASEVLYPVYASTPSSRSGRKGGNIPTTLRFGVGIAGRALQLKEPILVQDAEQHPWFIRQENSPDMSSLLSTMIMDPDGEKRYGTITIYSKSKQIWNIQDEYNLTCLAYQASFAFTRAKRLIELKEKGSVLKGISDEIRKFDLRGGEELLYKKITSAAVNTLEFGAARLRILDEKTGNLVTKAISGIEGDVVARISNDPIPLSVISPFLTPKYRVERSYIIHHEDPDWQEIVMKYFYIPEQTMIKQAGWRAKSALLTPLIGQNDQLIGILSLDMPKDGLFPPPETLEAIGVFSGASAWALELARAQSKIDEQRKRSWDLLESLGPKLASIRDFESLGELIVQFGTQIISAEGCSLHIIRDDKLELTHSSFLAGTRYIGKKKRISKADKCGLSCWVAATGEELCFSEEIESHKDHPAWAEEDDHLICLDSGYCHSLLIVPVRSVSIDGKIIGVITLENKKSLLGLKNFDEDDKSRIRVLASQFSQAMEMMKKYEIIQKWERKEFEDELHDIINWYHSGVVLGLDALSEWFRRKNYSKVKKELPLVLKRAYTSVNELKTLHTDLGKSPATGIPLRRQLESMISDWINRATPRYEGPIKVRLECNNELKLPELIQSTLVRIASGAIANSILHSQIVLDPKISIGIEVAKTGNMIRLMVCDNGKGKKHIKEGYGIARMKQLTKQLIKKYEVQDANFDINSGPDIGTTITVSVLLPENTSSLIKGKKG